jgi:hypothetical protein
MYLPVVKKCFWENNKASCGRAKKEKGAVRIKCFKKNYLYDEIML